LSRDGVSPESVVTEWSALPEAERAARLERAEALYSSMPAAAAAPWSGLTAMAQKFAALLLPVVERTEANPDPVLDTVHCQDCGDRAITITDWQRARFCRCELGQKAAAGFWLAKTEPWDNDLNRRVRSTGGCADFEKFLRSRLAYDVGWAANLRRRVEQLSDSERRRQSARQERTDRP